MLAFVIPVKSRQASADWGAVTALLTRTLRSVCAQTTMDYVVVVVCSQRPEVRWTSPKIHYVGVDFPLELSQRDPIEILANPQLEVRRVDKGRKLYRGCVEALRLGASHLMLVDADDVVSRRIAAEVQADRSAFGWYLNTGYSYTEGTGTTYLKRHRFQVECGTSHILRGDLLDLPATPEYDRGYNYYRLLLNHGYIVDRMRRQQTPLKPLPFRGAVYTLNGENLFRQPPRRPMSLLRRWLNLRPLTQRIRDEFGLYDLGSEPPFAAPVGGCLPCGHRGPNPRAGLYAGGRAGQGSTVTPRLAGATWSGRDREPSR